MPATSVRQRKFFGAVRGGAIPKPKGMSDQAVKDFASTPEKGLPKETDRRDTKERKPYGAPAPAPHMADGGKADGHWMEKAFKNAGKPGHSLHASLNVAADKPIPAGKMAKALLSKDSHVQHMAQAAENAGAGRKRPRFGG